VASVIWVSGPPSGSPQVLDASYRSARGVWQGPVALVFSRTGSIDSPQLGMDEHGDAFAAWRTGSGRIEVAEHLAKAAAWSPPVTVVKDARAVSLALVVAPGGTLAVVWAHYLSGSVLPPMAGTRDLLYVKVKPAGDSSWLPRLSLGVEGAESGQNDASIFQYSPRLAVNARGTVFVAWQWPDKSTTAPAQRSSPRPATGASPGSRPCHPAALQ
jgi:hypothetical protein